MPGFSIHLKTCCPGIWIIHFWTCLVLFISRTFCGKTCQKITNHYVRQYFLLSVLNSYSATFSECLLILVLWDLMNNSSVFALSTVFMTFCQYLSSLSLPGLSFPKQKGSSILIFYCKTMLHSHNHFSCLLCIIFNYIISFGEMREKALHQVIQCINVFQRKKKVVSGLASIFFLMMPNILFGFESRMHTEMMISKNCQWEVQDLLPEL